MESTPSLGDHDLRDVPETTGLPEPTESDKGDVSPRQMVPLPSDASEGLEFGDEMEVQSEDALSAEVS